MKKKDLIYLILAVIILLGAGYLAYTQVVAPKSQASKQDVTAEVVGEIKPDFNADALSAIEDSAKNKDYSVEIDVNSGVNNAAVFGK
jgi:flagellar basal body-associated protein FliL